MGKSPVALEIMPGAGAGQKFTFISTAISVKLRIASSN